MMPASVFQNSFTGGEIAPSLFGRFNLERYGSSLSLLRNMFVRPDGPISNRGGTKFIGEVKTSSAVTRLIPFQFSTSDAYCLEFGNQYIRFYRDGGRVLETGKTITGITKADPAVVTSASHGFSDGDWVYIASVGGMTQVNGKYFKVAGAATHTFQLNDVDGNAINSSAYTTYTSGGTASRVYTLATSYVTADLPLLKYGQSADTMYLTHPTYAPAKLTRTGHTSWTLTALSLAPALSAPTGLSMAGSGSYYKVTAVTASGEESVGSSAEQGAPSNPLTWGAVVGAAHYDIYKAEGGSTSAYGWIHRATGTSFTEPTEGIIPDYNISPPTLYNPFSGASLYPGCCAFFDQRLSFGRSDTYPDTLWLTVVGAYENFCKSSPVREDDSCEFTLASTQVNEIRWIAPLKDLIIGTSGGEWVVSPGSQSDTISPISVYARQQSTWGVSDHQPLIIGHRVLFIDSTGEAVRDLGYSVETQSYTGSELSIYAPHLFSGYEPVEWCFQKKPYPIVWIVREDGVLLGLTYNRDQEVWGWHHHDTQGEFESVCCLRDSDGTDEVWVIVNRTVDGTTRRYVELFQERTPFNDSFERDVRDSFFVDCGLSLDSPVTITGATNADPVVVTAALHGFSDGDLVDILEVGGMTELNGGQFTVASAATNSFELEGIDGTEYGEYTSGGKVRKAVTSLSGLDHLEGMDVAILANGSVVTGKAVSSGAITLDDAASIVHVGLGYTAQAELLPLEVQVREGTLQDKIVQIASVVLRLEHTRDLWVGPESDNLVQVPFRTTEAYGAPTEPYTGDKEQTLYPGEVGKIYPSQLFFQVSDPVPVTLQAIIMRLDYGSH